MTPAHRKVNCVLILDFGSQYGQLIARRVREQNVFCQIVRHDLPATRIAELKPRGLILSGGPASVYEPGAPHCDPAIFDLGIPVLGICYGMQLACQALGGKVTPGASREFGRAHCRIHEPTVCSPACPSETVVWMSHGDQVQSVNGRLRRPGDDRYLPRGRRPPSHRPVYGIAVPSRSQPHAPRQPHPAQFPLRRLRLPRAVADGIVHRADGQRSCGSGSASIGSSAACRAASIPR